MIQSPERTYDGLRARQSSRSKGFMEGVDGDTDEVR